jgi:hypothetical protein
VYCWSEGYRDCILSILPLLAEDNLYLGRSASQPMEAVDVQTSSQRDGGLLTGDWDWSLGSFQNG